MDRQLQSLMTDIHREAGGPFNINSTQQLGDVLFTRLNLPRNARPRPVSQPM